MVENEENKIELRSEEFQDVLGYIPPWILRWGITVIGIIILILIIGSSIFKYPDVISSTITLTGTIPPAAVMAQSSGKLTELLVTDNQSVKTGKYLGIIDNPANTQDIILLKTYIHKLNLENDTTSLLLPPKDLILGNIQSQYASFYITLFEYIEYKRLKYFSSKIAILEERIIQIEKQYENTQRQKKVIGQQLDIAQRQFERDSILYTKGLISDEIIENVKVQYLQAILSYENICNTLDNMQIQISQTKESLFETEFQYIEKDNTFKSQLRTLTVQLQNGIQSWEKSYVLCAPIDGKITFTNYWAVNQNIETGSIAFNIIPSVTDNQLIGKASLPVLRSGKVKTGQKVNIRLDNFPDNEYGIVRGIIKNISLIPVKDNQSANYAVEIELANGLETSYNMELPYLPGMQGTAEIITDDITLLNRFIMPIRKILNEGLYE